MGVPSSLDRQNPPDRPPSGLRGALARVGIDFPRERRLPHPARWAVALVIAVVGSVAADAALVALGTTVFPATKGYTHFQLSDYGKLTVIGVVIACLGWPVVAWASSSARRLFLWLAVLVTLVLWLPDLWILWQGQPPRAVAVLMVMHVAIALVTYNVLVHVAPASSPAELSPGRP